MLTAVYPGSFDPITNGHPNLIERGLNIFERLIIGISTNIRKKCMFTFEERSDMLRHTLRDHGWEDRVEVDAFDGLLVEYARSRKATAILRGLRAVADFEYEFQMAHMNRRLAENIETVFMMTGEEHFYVSSSLVREVAHFGGSVTGLVPAYVEDCLLKRIEELRSA